MSYRLRRDDDQNLLIALVAAVLLIYILLSKAHGAEQEVQKHPFQRYAWLSEQDNTTLERWHRQDKALYANLFGTYHPDGRLDLSKLTVLENKRVEQWMTDNPTLFRLMLEAMWPESVIKPAKQPPDTESLGLIRI